MKFEHTMMLDDEIVIIEYLRQCDKYFFNTPTESISDTEYDILKSKAKEKYPDNIYFEEIGSPVLEKNQEVKLPYILGSLDKYKIDTIDKWLTKHPTIVESEKLDGVSILVTWENGVVVFASTKGDGDTGQDITSKAKIICKTIPKKDKITLRGEMLLTGDAYLKLGYKNNRAGVVGITNNDSPLIDSLKRVKAIFYEYIDGPVEFKTELDRLNYISNILLLDTPKYKLISSPTCNNLVHTLFEYKKEADYEIDGLVLTDNNSEREDVLKPKDKVSFKVNEDAVKTVATGVELNVSRTGKIIPVILVEPTEINGTTVRRAAGFNAKYIFDKKINKGSIIGLIKAGEIIPYITEVFEPSETSAVDNIVCPSCNSMVVWDGVNLVCTNMNGDCKVLITKQIAHFFKVLGAEYMAESTISKLSVSSIEDMYDLDELEIASIDGLGVKKADRIVNEIQKTLKTTPAKLLNSFGINSIGKTLSTELTKRFTIDELFDNIDIKELSEILGPKTLVKFTENIGKYLPLYMFLKERGLKFEETGGSIMLDGKSLALTGKAPVKRELVVSLIEKNGGMVSGVSKTTDILVTSDVNSTSGKTKKARTYGTEIISYEDLFEMIEE